MHQGLPDSALCIVVVPYIKTTYELLSYMVVFVVWMPYMPLILASSGSTRLER